jgi:hypothetical protein
MGSIAGDKIRSMVKPDPIWIKDKNNLSLTLRFRSNVQEVSVDDMSGGTHTEYEYDEAEMIQKLAPDLLLKDLPDYLNNIVPPVPVVPPIVVPPVPPTKPTNIIDQPVEVLRQAIVSTVPPIKPKPIKGKLEKN